MSSELFWQKLTPIFPPQSPKFCQLCLTGVGWKSSLPHKVKLSKQLQHLRHWQGFALSRFWAHALLPCVFTRLPSACVCSHFSNCSTERWIIFTAPDVATKPQGAACHSSLATGSHFILKDLCASSATCFSAFTSAPSDFSEVWTHLCFFDSVKWSGCYLTY